MAKVSVCGNFTTSADQVWSLIGKFGGIANWHPAVKKSNLTPDGAYRQLGLVGGGAVIDRLVSHDDVRRIYRYFSIDSPLPVAEYSGMVSVEVGKGGTGSIVELSAEFVPAGFSEADSASVVRSVCEAGIENLKIIFGEKKVSIRQDKSGVLES